jgi:putative transposase
MTEESNRFGVTFLGWCLITNHVHLIAVPERVNRGRFSFTLV